MQHVRELTLAQRPDLVRRKEAAHEIADEGGSDRRERENADEERPENEPGRRQPSPGLAPAGSEGVGAEGGEDRHGEVHGEEGLAGKAEAAQRRQRLHDRADHAPPAEADDDRDEGQHDEAKPKDPAAARAHGRDGQRGRAEIEAQEVGKPARKEVLPPPAVRHVRQVAVEVSDDHLEQRQGMDGLGEDHRSGESTAALADRDDAAHHARRGGG